MEPEGTGAVQETDFVDAARVIANFANAALIAPESSAVRQR